MSSATPDLRAQIADILDSHQLDYVNHPDCTCGQWTAVMAESHTDHVAAMITDLLIDLAGTGDGCIDHYPRHCPPDCPHAGRHDDTLAGLCECHQCRQEPSC